MVRKEPAIKTISTKNNPVHQGKEGSTGGVAAALVWERKDTDEKKMDRPDKPNYRRYLMDKAELGKPLNRGFNRPPPRPPKEVDPDNTVLQAIRGWPKPHQPQRPHSSYELQLRSLQDKQEKPPPRPQTRAGFVEESTQTNMPDLMSHTYLRKWAGLQTERERAAQETERRSLAEKKRLSLGKDTRASQMRTIAVHNRTHRVTFDSKELWQMPRFTKSAQPRITTRSRKTETIEHTQTMRPLGLTC